MLYISVENEGEFLKITIPRLSTSNAITFCRTLQECQRDDTYFFDVSGVNNYEPLPMLLTAASIRQFCEQRDLGPWDIQLLYSENKNYDYACHMGFFQAAGFPQGKAPGEAPGSSSYIPLTKLNIGEMQQEAIEKGEYMEQGDLIERKSDELAAVLAQGNRELQKMFRYLIREAIRNVPEHAGTNEVWICGQYWHNRDKAEIAILDEGKLRHHTNTINKDIHYFVCSNNKVDYRGECPGRHYVRADAIEQVVMLELRRMAEFLVADEEAFAELLAQKTDKELLKEKKHDEAELQKAIARNDTVSRLYEKLYEDNAVGKVSDEWFMQLSHKYEAERLELKSKIKALRQKLSECGQREQERENFTSAIRRFMRMDRLTAPLLHELIDYIDVFETEGKGKNRTQRIVIYYRFVGYVEIPEVSHRPNIIADTRKGVAVEYLTEPLPA